MTKLLHADLTEKILGAFYQVHYELGPGFLESVYSAAMAIMMMEMGLRVEREVPIAVYFHGIRVRSFKADSIVESKVLLEYKACARLTSDFEAIVLNYLRASEMEVALLLNFGPKPTFKRFVASNEHKILHAGSASSADSANSAVKVEGLADGV